MRLDPRVVNDSLNRWNGRGSSNASTFFILSDSRDPDKWVEEERRWCELMRELDALGRIYYRRRISVEGKKSGNVRDFLNAWGRRYRYFIVLMRTASCAAKPLSTWSN